MAWWNRRQSTSQPQAARPVPQPFVAALTAAAKVMDGTDDRSTKLKREGWQTLAWDYFGSVGEAHYSANFVGGCYSRCTLHIAVLDPDGKPGPAFEPATEDDVNADRAEAEGDPIPLHPLAEQAAELLSDLRPEDAGQGELLRRAGVNLTVAGDCTLLGTPSKVLASGRQFEVLSTDELRSDAEGKAKRYRSAKAGTMGEDIPEDHTTVRVWRADPRYSDQADSPFRAVLDILEELVLLTRGVRATTTSRLAGAGILIVAREIDYPDTNPTAVPDTEAADPFTADLIATMTTPIGDKGSAAAVVPFVLRPQAEYCDSKYVRHMDLSRQFDAFPSVALRKEAVQRFAQGIDLPVEIVTGHANTTFSNAWQIDESTYKTHIEPGMGLVCEAITTGYLHPALKSASNSAEGYGQLIVWFDPSELVVHPNRAGDAKDLYDRFELTGAALRRETGFSDTDTPDEDEVEERIRRRRAVRQRDDSTTDDGAPGAGDITDGDLAAMLAAAGEVTIRRAVDRFGARLRSRANGANGLHAAIDGTPNRDVARVLGPANVATLCPSPDEWFAPDLAPFREVAADIIDDPGTLDRVVALVASAMAQRLYSPVGLLTPATLRPLVETP